MTPPRTSFRTRALSHPAGALVALCLVLLHGVGCVPRSYWAAHSGQGVRLSSDPYANALVAQAKAMELASSPAWRKLLHYRPDPLGGTYRSEADGTAFFLSPDGKYDPEAELEATIRAFLAAPTATDEKSLNAHPACRFPARLFTLVRDLKLDLARVPVKSCPGFEKLLSEMRPAAVSVIFTSYYLNNPASAFGHTFLRIDKAGTFAIGKRRELLDYGIDFSADVTTSNSLLYAVMGLTGMFEGTFKRVPYYYKVREYNDVESRDLWEYTLEFSPEQLLMLVGHIWEVGQTHFDYYYLGENCSYHILGLIEAVRPDLDLIDRVTSPVIPAATVQALFDVKGLVRSSKYRPSLRTQFASRIESLSRREQGLIEQLAYEPDTALPADLSDERKIAVLDAAVDLVDIQFAKELLFDREGEGSRRKQRLLERRAQILKPSPELTVVAADNKAPERGHAPRRIGASFGRDARDNLFVGTDFRLALHDLGDPSDGFLDLSQIEFLPVRLRLGNVGSRFRVRVDEAAVVRVVSLSSLERFDKHVSFQISAGLKGVDDRYCRTCTAGHMLVGGGVAKAFLHDAIGLWFLTDTQIYVGPAFREGSPVPVRAGVGPSVGLRLRLHPRLVALGRGYFYYQPYQDPEREWRADASLRWAFVRNLALSAEGRWVPAGPEGQVFFLSYF